MTQQRLYRTVESFVLDFNYGPVSGVELNPDAPDVKAYNSWDTWKPMSDEVKFGTIFYSP